MHERDRSDERRASKAELGLAIGRRAEEVYERTIRLLYRRGQGTAPSTAYLDYRWGRSVVGTLLIARWLVSGIAADKDEIDWISRSGGAAAREGVPLVCGRLKARSRRTLRPSPQREAPAQERPRGK